MQQWQAKVFISSECSLGEGPDWQPSTKTLSWVDINQGILFLHNLETDAHTKINIGQVIGFAIPCNLEDSFVLGTSNSLQLFHTKTKEKSTLETFSYNTDFIRFNDAKCDAMGRLWAGTTTQDLQNHPGALYKKERRLPAKEIFSKIGCSNGLCWNANNTKMYYIDTISLSLKIYDFDLETGTLSNENLLLQYPKENGYLDGMTIDAEGKLWIAIWGGSKVIRFCPEKKEIIGEILVDAKQVSSITFAGNNLEKCFITSARQGLSTENIQNQKTNGALFICETGIKGTQNNFFKI